MSPTKAIRDWAIQLVLLTYLLALLSLHIRTHTQLLNVWIPIHRGGTVSAETQRIAFEANLRERVCAGASAFRVYDASAYVYMCRHGCLWDHLCKSMQVCRANICEYVSVKLCLGT
jgi:hypothetical protein